MPVSAPGARGAGQSAAIGNWPPVTGHSPPPATPHSALRASQSSSPPLPAVARIIVPEKDGVSFGSGTLIDARGQFGLVVSNWHVVRDAAGPITVEFPDGFKSPAEVVKTDKDWDLAALSIYRPRVAPVPITAVAPQPGDSLTIGGYGSGDWRTATGRCTQYLAPGVELPHEMVELAAEARQGDSGGPILNQRGELAGVLFGSGPGYTSGSYGGRVLQFLASVVPNSAPGNDGLTSNSTAGNAPRGIQSADEPSAVGNALRGVPGATEGPLKIDLSTAPSVTPPRQSLSPEPPQIATALTPAAKQPPDPLLSPPAKAESATRFGPSKSPFGAPDIDPRVAVTPSPHDVVPSTLPGDNQRPFASERALSSFTSLEPGSRDDGPTTDLHRAEPTELALAIWDRLSGPTLYDQTKTVLAIIGALSLAILFLRFGSRDKERYHEEECE